jgi:hypothetical protein
MRVFVATLIDLENTQIVGVYTSEDVAVSKIEEAMEELYIDNEDLGVYPVIVEKLLDDKDIDDYV